MEGHMEAGSMSMPNILPIVYILKTIGLISLIRNMLIRF